MVITYEDYLKNKRKRLKEAAKGGAIPLEKYAEITGMDLSKIGRASVPKQTVESTISLSEPEEETKDEKWYEGWFKESQGDLGQTVAGSTADATENVLTGGMKIGEGFLDTMAFLAPILEGVNAAKTGQIITPEHTKKMQKQAQELIGVDLIDEESGAKALITDNVKKLGIDTDKHSVFDAKTDSLFQSAGQLATTAVLCPVVPWYLTTGVSSFGAEAENASRQGATYAEAGGSGLISAGAEILTEKLSGAIKFGGKTLDEKWVKPLTENISNSVLRTMAKLGFDAAGEGTEEVVSQVFSNLGSALYKEEDLGTIMGSQEALDGYIESFIGGAALGGVMGSGKAAVDTKKGIDYATELTQNEKAVVDAIAEERFKEAEKNGKKLSLKEKSKIRSEIEAEMDDGAIDIDKIESILGGDEYKTYKDMTEKENSLLREEEALRDAPNTIGNAEAIEEIRRQIKELKNTRATQTAKDNLYNKVQELTKNDRLVESYKEKGRRGVAFEADLAKYDAKQQAVIQKAIDSGILNNTNRTHKFVDMIAKISADKGVSFDFTNNQKLKESGFALEGKTVNGFIQDGNISLNINSAKALNKVVGHEITHVLEGTELYTELQNVVKEYATTKGEYESRFEALKSLYKDVEGANIENELTADLVGDYLFSDPDFVNSLSTEQPNIFKKIYDEIKYMVKVATAGSKEEKQLLEVKRAFDKAYKENTSAKAEEKARYDVSEDKDLYQYIQDALNGKLSKKSYHKLSDSISDRLAHDIEKIVGFSVEGYGNEISPGNIEHINKDHGPNGESDKSMSNLHDLAKLNYVIENYDNIREGKISRQYKNRDGSYSKTVELQKKIDDKFYYVVEAVPDAKLKTLHVVSAYINKNDTFLEEAVSKDPSRYVQDELQSNVSSNYIISEDTENTTPTYSISEDSQGRKLSNEQIEYFKDSKVRDENGALIPVYHGTPLSRKQVTKDRGWQSDGTYKGQEAPFFTFKGGAYNGLIFTSLDYVKAKEIADYRSYHLPDDAEGNEQYTEEGYVYELYVNAVKPFRANNEFDVNNILKEFKSKVPMLSYYGGRESYVSISEAREILKGSNSWMISETEAFQRKVKDLGYDAIIAKDDGVEYVAVWNPNQLKDTDNQNPTENDDIRYSLSSNEDLPIRSDIYGSDIELDIPIRDDIAPVQDLMDDIPIRKDIPKVGDFDDIPIRADVQQSDEEKYKPKQTDYPSKKVTTVAERNEAQREALKTQLQEKQRLAEEVHNTYNREIAELQQSIERIEQLRIDSHASFNRKMSQLRSEYDATLNKDTKSANALLQQIENTRVKRNEVETQYENQIYDLQGKIAEKKRHRADSDANSEKAINDLKARIDKMNTKEFKRAEKRMTKQEQRREFISNLIGDTSTWVDKKMGIYYKVNTLRRNLRDIVRDENGNPDYKKADAIYDFIQGAYNHHEAQLNREANAIKQKFRDMKITKEEDAYIQMLGEYRHNPHTEILAEEMTEFYNKHKDKIDEEKVDKIIDMAREMYDGLFVRLNEVLREQGMQEIQYHKGYFPHFTEDKQGPIAKLFGWKTKNDDIPTDIAGLTENFNPDRSWQSFNKHRTGDSTDYSFMKGLDNYVQGSLDWIYHIDDIQNRRALENEIRYRHSEKGIQDRIEKINSNEEYSAEEAQAQIDMVWEDAKNPLNNFVSTFRTQTNTLAGKKSSMDREAEQDSNRRFYSTVTNLSNRVNANMVGGSISSALTNFIPITQSWAEVSPISSLQAMKEAIASYHTNDGTIDKSDFLTNRLRKNDALYKSWWDKAGDKIGWLMEACDDFTSQTVWRSKYMENISNGMSEAEAIKNADQFAENIMAGRSRGNAPAIFDSKRPAIKMLTAFQLEVNNQYQYMFKDLPQEMQNETKGKMIAAYGKMFVGAYVYNAVYSSLTGRDAAFDPISIIEGVLRDMGLFDEDEEKEPGEIVGNLVADIIEEVPFVGGLMGGGRIPISSALPYDGISTESIQNLITDISEGDMESIWKEMLNPVFYLVSPAGGGGQLRKTLQGLKMFDDDLPIAGSYTDSGKLRFSVDDNLPTRLQAAVFGQYASENARDYFDNGRSPLTKKQTRELVMLDIPIRRYWDYRQGLKKIEADKDEDGNSIPGSKKQKVIEYIDSLDVDFEEKLILFKFQYPADDTYNYEILEYLKSRTDISDAEKKVILKDLDFTVDENGNVRW